MSDGDFDFEPVRGIPAALPAGEQMLWQGAPSWRAVARRVFHADKIAVYFGVLMLWRFAATLHDGLGVAAASWSALRLLPLGLAAVTILALFAWGVGRSTVYTITSKRIIMRFGMALPLTINLPFRQFANVDLKVNRDTTGDIAVTLDSQQRIAFAVLWPHVRPFFLGKPQPMLVCLAEPERVGGILTAAIAASTVASPAVAKENDVAQWPQRYAAAE
jgi:Bacterial PH domain